MDDNTIITICSVLLFLLIAALALRDDDAEVSFVDAFPKPPPPKAMPMTEAHAHYMQMQQNMMQASRDPLYHRGLGQSQLTGYGAMLGGGAGGLLGYGYGRL